MERAVRARESGHAMRARALYSWRERERASFVEAPETGVNCQPLGRASPDIVVLQSLNSRTSRSVWSYANNRTTTIWMYPFVYFFANNQPRFRRKKKEILNYDEIIALWISRFRRKRISQIRWNLGNYLENPNSHYLISILQHNFSKILSITLKLILIRYPRRERIFSQSFKGCLPFSRSNSLNNIWNNTCLFIWVSRCQIPHYTVYKLPTA